MVASSTRSKKSGGGEPMDDIWRDSDYMICPSCNQVVRREDLIRGIHFCYSKSKQWLTLPAVE